MSHADEHHGARPRTEEDHVPTARILMVGAISLIVFFVASLWATRILDSRREQLLPAGAPPAPAFAGKDEVGIVDLDTFGAGRSRGEKKRAEKLQRLGSYGWVDQKTGVVHIPIERAMELTAQGVKP